MDARHICDHKGDCSIWSVHPISGEKSKICDCGRLRTTVFEGYEMVENRDVLAQVWMDHLTSIDKSMGV